MGWSVNRLIFKISFLVLCALTICGSAYPTHMELDPDKWDKLRRGLDYNEASPPDINQSANNVPPPVGLGVWMDMLRIFLFIILIGALIYLIVRLILNTKKPDYNRKKPIKSEKEEILPTALSTMEQLWEHYHKSKDAGDYRECLRVLYQISLKKLAENGWIETLPDKTNTEYLNELKSGAVANEFARLTQVHEYSWYGDTTVEVKDFKTYEPWFMNFINSPEVEKK